MFSLVAVVNLAICATRLISGGVIPASTGRNIVSVYLIHPVIICNKSFRKRTGNNKLMIYHVYNPKNMKKKYNIM